LSKLLISNLPLRSTANAWGNYGIFTTPPLPLSFVFKVDREPSLERESGRSRYLLNRSFYPGGAPRRLVRYRLALGGVPIALAAFRSQASRAADSPLKFSSLGPVDRFAILDGHRPRRHAYELRARIEISKKLDSNFFGIRCANTEPQVLQKTDSIETTPATQLDTR
jgi:hypothetical protein